MAFEQILSGGKPNSLGRTGEVVRIVARDRRRLRPLFDTLRSEDELVRMRAGDALEKVCRQRPEWFRAYVPRLLGEVSRIDQPSVQWHLAQMLGAISLSPDQHRRAKSVLKRNLERSDDWIVLNVTMQQLFDWSRADPPLRRWLLPRLEQLAEDPRRSVASRARRLLDLHAKRTGDR